MEVHGRFEEKIGSPRGIIKMAYQCGMIDDSGGWLTLLESRNVLAHTYSEEKVMDIIGKIKEGYTPLLEELKVELDRNWL